VTTATSPLTVWKGHGTENDFVLIDDRDGRLELTVPLVRALCDRHSGLGADGVLRVVRSAYVPLAAASVDEAAFFMDYRNADGSIAEMCGNGIRLFALYLNRSGLAGADMVIATRGGLRRVQVKSPDEITVEMGPAKVLDGSQSVIAHSSDRSWPATGVRMPNPHVVVEVGSLATLEQLDLSSTPLVEPGLEDGQNVEFVVRTGQHSASMRVYERGSGETRSCGTGICAAVVALAAGDAGPELPPDGEPWRVAVPGGTCVVRWRADGEVLLTGPATLVGQFALDDDWLTRAGGQS
jgi:diaminopimelate epimerase